MLVNQTSLTMSMQFINHRPTQQLLHARSSDGGPGELAAIQQLVSEIRTAKYFYVALATLLVYHSIITLDKEVHYFWTKRWNSANVVYFSNRYIGLMGAIAPIFGEGFNETSASCQATLWITSIANLVVVVLIDYILLIRVLALSGRDKRLAIILKGILVLDTLAGLGLLIHGNVLEQATAEPVVDDISVCAGLKPPLSETIASWSIPLVYGVILLVPALWKAAEYWKMSAGFRGFELVKVVLQDQVLYFSVAISCCVLRIVNISAEGISPFAASAIAAAASPTLLCVLGGQLLINLKGAAERGANAGTSYKTISEIHFT